MSDFFIEDADEWRCDAWDVIRQTPQHLWIILTKRPERILQCLPSDWGNGYEHVCLGVSVESQKYLKRIDILRECPGHSYCISFEPLLEPLGELDLNGIGWIIAGGESDANFRPMDHAWAREIRDQCVERDIPFFFKQSAAPRPEMGLCLEEPDGTRTTWCQKLGDLPVEETGFLALEKIRLDGEIQMRAKMDEPTVAEYEEAMKNGTAFPPVDVFFDGEKYWLSDGFHRVEAYAKARQRKIPVTIHEGLRRDAMLFAFGANTMHGLRRTNKDKRKVVEGLLKDEEWGKWSDREIARRCRVSDRFVNKVRADVPANIRSEDLTERTYRNKHGTVSIMHTENIGQAPVENTPESNPLTDSDLETIGDAAVEPIDDDTECAEPGKQVKGVQLNEYAIQTEGGDVLFDRKKINQLIAETKKSPGLEAEWAKLIYQVQKFRAGFKPEEFLPVLIEKRKNLFMDASRCLDYFEDICARIESIKGRRIDAKDNTEE